MSEASFPEIAPLPAVMNMKEVGELIGITSETARRLINDGALPGHRVPGGRQWVFRTEEVLAAISGWSTDGELDTSEPERPHGSDAFVGPVASTEPIRDSAARVVSVCCPAPVRSPAQSDDDYLADCMAAWITAASLEGVHATPVDANTALVGGRRIALGVETQQVHVIDELGDDEFAPIAIVIASDPQSTAVA